MKGIGALFGGGASKDTQAQEAQAQVQAQQNRLLEQIAQSRAQQQAQDSADTADKGLAAGGAQPRGRRLLLSPEGGGLASTLGGSA